MHILPVSRVVGTMLIVLGGAQLLPMGLAIADGSAHWRLFLGCAAATAAAGVALKLCGRRAAEMTERDGFPVVTFCWLLAAFAGAAPYVLAGATESLTDALFESMSGFTTTGATVFSAPEGLGRSLLLWRSMTQWFGGLGTLVLAVVILPALGVGGMEIYKREVPRAYAERFAHRIRDTARALWMVYVLLTVLETGVLYVLGMSAFEAFNHALTTVSTGGFATRAGSIGAFHSPAITWAVILFMLAAGMNFVLHYRSLMRKGHRTAHLSHPEWRWYMLIALLTSLAICAYLALALDYGWFEAVTKGAFAVVSILTTSGYHVDDYVSWGSFPQLLLLLGMFVGGCWGSTSGGVKLARVVVVFRYLGQEMLRLVHPKAVIYVKLGSTRVTLDIIGSIQAYFFLYLISLAAVTLLISLDGHSLMTSLGAGVSALSNVGPGFGEVGPAGTYAHFSGYAKWVMIAAMLVGRLELMTVLVLLNPKVWRG